MCIGHRCGKRLNDSQPDTLSVAVGERLERIYHVAAATGHLARFIVFGSFVTDKPARGW